MAKRIRQTKADLLNEIIALKTEVARLEELDPIIPLKKSAAAARNILSEALNEFENKVPNWNEWNNSKGAVETEIPESVIICIDELS